jgi:hypothetical protein
MTAWHIGTWWHSPEALSRMQNYLAVCVVLVGAATLTLRWRSEKLKKLADAPRQITEDQRAKFVSALANIPKGEVTIVLGSKERETIAFLPQIRSLLTDAGFTVPEEPEYAISYVITPPTPPPWFVALIAGEGGERPDFAIPLQQALRDIGINAPGIPGKENIARPGEIKLYIGGR